MEILQSCTKPSTCITTVEIIANTCIFYGIYNISGHFVNAPSQWETMLHCNVASHWLDALIHKMIPAISSKQTLPNPCILTTSWRLPILYPGKASSCLSRQGLISHKPGMKQKHDGLVPKCSNSRALPEPMLTKINHVICHPFAPAN